MPYLTNTNKSHIYYAMIIVAKNACIIAQTCINLCLTEIAVAMKQES